MNKLFALSLATAISVSVLAIPLSSKEAPSSIVVMPVPSQEVFVERVSEDLERQLNRNTGIRNDVSGEGIAIVRFVRDTEGSPAEIRMMRRTGNSGLDRLAIQAVRRLSTLEAVPEGVGPGQIFQANIVFANTDHDFAKLSDQLAREEAARIAASPEEHAVFAFGSAPSRPTS